MNLCEKILCHQAVGLSKPYVEPGEVIVVKVARTLGSELTLVGIKTCLEAVGKPDIWRKDRFFLACDHSVDPRNYEEDVIQKRIEMCREFSQEQKLVDYFGPNESILHTEFYRQRAEPGTVVIGADSHSCSHGCVGCYAMGMGAADVAMPLITGTTWYKVPETILISFKGTLPKGMCGKDVMLWILKLLKRNTVALDRCVEFGGDLSQLSIDSRFAISNMASEFGALAGVFPGDEATQGFIEHHRPTGKEGAPPDGEKPIYFRADPDAKYANSFTINLEDVRPTVAKWPSPDDVYLITDTELYTPLIDRGNKVCETIRCLDGCFIGACTTTESEIVLAAMVLDAAMTKLGKVPVMRSPKEYKRRITPGSRIMAERLEKIGIMDIYRKAGFQVGAAGCSYCLGVAFDRAQDGEVWLSSQNRNFRNRMGRGAFGNVTSAAVVAMSSFDMEITDPSDVLANHVDYAKYEQLTNYPKCPITISEPLPHLTTETSLKLEEKSSTVLGVVSGRAQVFGDGIDTDAIIPAAHIPLRGPEQGHKSFCIYRPDFVKRVEEGHSVIVAGTGFGCGSSREEAVSCLKFAGVKAVIAKSFSFIYGRNLLTLSLLGIQITDESFYELAVEGSPIELDVSNRTACVMSNPSLKFKFDLPQIQEHIYEMGGVVQMYKDHGEVLFSRLAKLSAACGSCGVSW